MPLRVLIKLPSRERPQTLLRAATLYANLASDRANTRMMINLDLDDPTVSDSLLERLGRLGLPTLIIEGHRVGKIGAYNRDLPGREHWDVLVAASDDQWPVEKGYDNRIRRDMEVNFPDLDGMLWYHDGRQHRVCTLSIIGRTYFDRTGRVYWPEYKSYYCDDEETAIAMRDGKMVRINTCIIHDEHPHHRGKVSTDDLYRFNRGFKNDDRMLFHQRQAAGFPGNR